MVFDGVVRSHSDITLTCQWNPQELEHYKEIKWKRLVGETIQDIWRFKGFDSHSTVDKNEATFEFVTKFIRTFQLDFSTKHEITLTDARKEDEGEYWCEVFIAHNVQNAAAEPKHLSVYS